MTRTSEHIVCHDDVVHTFASNDSELPAVSIAKQSQCNWWCFLENFAGENKSPCFANT